MKKKIQLFLVFIIFLLQPFLLFGQDDWQEYTNEKANIRFLIPSGFSVFEKSDSVSHCDFSIKLQSVEYSDIARDSLRVRYEAWLKIKLSKKNFDKSNQENRFYLKENKWIAKSLIPTSLANVEADSVESLDWFGLEADIYARYYYKEGGAATAAGQGYSFFAIKELAACEASLLFDNLGATENEVGQKVISSLQRLR